MVIGLAGLNFVKGIMENDLYQVISVLHRGDKTCVDVEHGLYLNLVAATQNVSHYFSIRMHKTHCPQGAPYGIRMEPMSVLWYIVPSWQT